MDKQYCFQYLSINYSPHWFAISKQQAKKEIRNYLKVKRLSKGFKIWEYKPKYKMQ